MWTHRHRVHEYWMTIFFDGRAMFYREWFGEEHATQYLAHLNETHPNGLDNEESDRDHDED